MDGRVMKRYLLIVFLICLVACGGGKKPTPPPIPPPEPPPPVVEKCGDDVCGPGETAINCPKDCKEDPPANVCGDEVLDKDCPRKPTDFRSNKTLGIYIGIDSTPWMDWVWLFKTIKETTKLNGIYVHYNSPWAHPSTKNEPNKGFYYFKFDPIRKVYLNERDPRWQQSHIMMLRAAAYYDIRVSVTFLNEYCNTKWLQNAPEHQSHYNPFRNNLAKVNLCGDGKGNAPLYRNWNRKLPLDKNVAWMKWVNENDISTFRPTNIAGEMIFSMTDGIIQDVKTVLKEFPNLKMTFRPANEPWRFVLPDQKSFDESRGNPLDDRTFTFFFEKLRQAGIRNGGNFRYVVEEEFLQGGAYINAYWTDKTYRQYTKKRGYLYEFHNVVKIRDCKGPQDSGDFCKAAGEDIGFFLDTLKMDPKDVYFSNDGDKGEKFDPKTYWPRMLSISRWQDKHPGSWMDYKLPSDVPPCKWQPKDIMMNLKCQLPQISKEGL